MKGGNSRQPSGQLDRPGNLYHWSLTKLSLNKTNLVKHSNPVKGLGSRILSAGSSPIRCSGVTRRRYDLQLQRIEIGKRRASPKTPDHS